MALVEVILALSEGSIGKNTSSITLEWLAFSDDIDDHSASIAEQGMIFDGAWKSSGTPYTLKNDVINNCFAGDVEVFDREIISGRGVSISVKAEGVTVDVPVGSKKIMYRVRQVYSTNNDSEVGDDPSETDDFMLDITAEYEELPFDKDVVTGEAVVNSAGFQFNPPATRRRKVPIISLTRMERRDPRPALAFMNHVDAATGMYLLDSVQSQYNSKIGTWSVTYIFKYKPEGWKASLLDTGFQERLPNGMAVPVFDDVGLPVSEPVKLNGNGAVLIDQDGEGVDVGPFNRYPVIDFAPLRVPYLVF